MKKFMSVPVLIFVVFSLLFTLITCGRSGRKAAGTAKLPLELTMLSGERSAWQESGEATLLEEGEPGLLEAPAWWEGTRPPVGEMVVLELEYLDMMNLPVRAEVYSGMDIRNPYSELHRFGGLGDGRWRTARIPCSWGFMLKHEPEGTVRFRLSSDSGRLTIRKPRLVEIRQEDEQRYNAETREWVSRVQGRARVDSAYYSVAQVPVLAGRWKDAPLVVYSRSWMDLVVPISAPREEETRFPVRVKMTRNEYQPLQLGIFANGRDLSGVELSVDPVSDGSGRKVVSVRVRVAEYSLVKSQVKGLNIQPFPQRLWPAYAFDIPAGRSHMAWIELQTEKDISPAGTYNTTIRVKAHGVEEVRVPLTVEILPLTLLTMDEAGLRLAGCTIGLIPEHEMAFLRRYNHNAVNLWYFSARPGLDKQGDSFSMDFRVMDDWMAAAMRNRIDYIVYFLGENPYSFPWTMSLERTLAKAVFGITDKDWERMAMEKPDSILPGVVPLYEEWTRRFRQHALANNWPKMNLTPFDEPAKWIQVRDDLGLGSLWYIKPHFLHAVELLRENFPEALISGDIHHYEGGIDFLPYLDIFCTNAVHENFDMPDIVRDSGKILWEYSGCSDKGEPAVARYTFGFYFAAHDSRGSLVWAYNWGKRFDTLEGSNWLYAWNTPFDVIPHPFMEGLREAWDERRLLETLKRRAAGKNVDIAGFLDGLFDEVHQNRGRGGTSTLDDFWEKARDNSLMELWHDRIVEKLLELEK